LYIPAGYFLSQLKLRSAEKKSAVAAVTLILSVFMLYFLYSLTRFIGNIGLIQDTNQWNVSLISLVSSSIIVLLIFVVLAWGWSLYLSMDAMMLLSIGLLAFAFIVPSMKSAGFDAKPKQNMWFKTTYFEDVDLFQKTIKQLDQNRLEKDKPLQIQVQREPSSSLMWELRDHTVFLKQSDAALEENEADVIITDANDSPLVSENRMGQDIILSKSPAWALMSIQEWVHWIVYQEPIYNDLQIIIWAYPYEGSLELSSDS
jgi:hypothetical protein